MLLIYSLYVAARLAHQRLSLLAACWKASVWVKFTLLALAAGLVTETLAWGSNYLSRSAEPALFHPQLAYDLLIGLGFYTGNALAWVLALRWFRFMPAQVFVTQGAFGVFVEQNGAVFRMGLASLPGGALLWLYVFLVYGSYIGIAHAFIQDELTGERRYPGWLKYPATLALVGVLTVAVTGLWLLPWQISGTIPPPMPIWEQPLW